MNIQIRLNNCCWFYNNIYGAWPKNDEGLQDLPLALRRRLTSLGRKVLETVTQCTENAIPWIISCRYGDIQRRLNLLSSLAKGEMLSPSDFSLSVHNAIIGMYTIVSDNKHMHSALAGGPYSFEMGLLETIAFIKEQGGQAGYCYYDHVGDQVICLALVLSLGGGATTIEYRTQPERDQKQQFNIEKFLEFFKNDEKRYKICVSGGEILIERTSAPI